VATVEGPLGLARVAPISPPRGRSRPPPAWPPPVRWGRQPRRMAWWSRAWAPELRRRTPRGTWPVAANGEPCG